MSSLLEVAAKIAADKEQASQLAGPLAAAKDQVEETADRLNAIGIERSAAQMQQVVTALEEAESIRAALEGGLQKAHWQVMSAAHGRIGPGAPGSGAIVPLVRKEGRDGALAGGLDAVPPHVRHGASPSGEELSGIDPSLSPFQKEHEGAGDDSKMGKLSRFGRKAVRNTGDLVDASKKIVDARADTFQRDYDPWGPSAQTTTEVPTAPPSTPGFYRPEGTDIRAGDVIGTSIVVAVIAVEGLSRILRKREHGK
ncbi:hypothetical protein [Glycomyces algeriensis]|uniref:Uncharacterized protein n=1 Tax=Glycomyces algeriensis TaxID=256037 RepID=A0A9W6LJA3_9ACTN|nr:hypothetical protein [Glycomyces algeriensis]MDA1368337.1 hypothetical protein [Glycomyces algeriensis]MDR7351778.1 hypothetical protein [Glycomyces algeriensis]GLI44506.1 hypothetical protein GALLR39Z86_43560 [Glycomyces algeriensis]